MAIHRGVQSAIFYYLSCAPIHDYNYRKRRKKEARKDREAREALQAEEPGLYRHPSPFSTNKHWDADRLMGPIPVRGQKKKARAESQQAMRSMGVESSTGGSNIASTVTLGADHVSDGQDDKWNRRLYQRHDEELWGVARKDDQQDLRPTLDGVPLSRPATAKTVDSSTSYHSKRNPAINDLHPPTVTRVQSREDVAWMLQPPPVAAVMHGSERPPRSRSDSGSSRPSARDSSVALSRQVSERIMLKKLKSSDTLGPPLSRTSTGGTALTNPGQRPDRSSPLQPTDEGESSADESPIKRKEKRRPKPLNVSEEESSGSAITVVRRPNGLPAHPSLANDRPLKVASRPQLSTIRSDSNAADEAAPRYLLRKTSGDNNDEDLRSSNPAEWRERAANRSPVLVNPDSRQGLQELVIPSNNLSANKTLAAKSSQVQVEARLHVRTRASRETMAQSHHRSSSEETLPGFETLFARDLDLPRWIEEHTRRDVAQRWSMDI